MYLKTLKLAGFKSFADRARLEFRPGVTVVVGPNGSGKSNLVDALSWVLGSQSPRALRTGKMDEVIFAGTATRPAGSRAEVTLVVDNTERLIDLDLDEVSITRRLYRDGSSDYELNGVACRLLDIQELLSDSGVGRHQHVIISQGEIGRILEASPEEHRAVIEEAAGILKHRRRKERAERRLERTGDDLARLADLVGEIERQMRPLKRQANAARRYQDLKSEVVALTLYLGGAELKRIDSSLEEAGRLRSELDARIAEGESKDRVLGGRLGRLETLSAQVAAELEAVTASAAVLETTTERLRRVISVADERARALSGRREQTMGRRQDLEAERADLSTQLSEVGSSQTELERRSAEAEAVLRRLEQEARALETQASLPPEGAVAAARGELSALLSAVRRDQEEIGSLRDRLSAIAAEQRAATAEAGRLKSDLEAVDAATSGLEAEYEGAAARRAGDQEVWDRATDSLNQARIEAATAATRVDTVAAALEGGGDPTSSRYLASCPDSLGVLGDLLDIPSEMEAAVRAALGPWATAVAFGDMGSVRDAVETAKEEGLAGVAAVAAMGETLAPAREVAARLGLEALVDLLGPDAEQSLAARLMGDVVLVEGWRAAWEVIARHPALRAVTPEGDLVTVSGVRVGNHHNSAAAMAAAAEEALHRAETELARAESIHVSVKRDFDRSREAERQALEALELAEAKLAARSEELARMAAKLESLDEERSRLEHRLSILERAVEDRSAQIPALESLIADLEGDEAAKLKSWEELVRRRESHGDELEGARARWHELATQARTLAERRKLLEERLAAVEREVRSLEDEPAHQGSPRALQAIGEAARSGVARTEESLQWLRDRQYRLRARRQELADELNQVRSSVEETRHSVAAARERSGALEIELTKLRLRRESVVETLRRDAGAEASDAAGAPRPDVGDDVDLSQLLESKTASLRRLGPVNPLAAGEYEALEERHSFLRAQIDDVESSRRELRKVIAALEEEIATRFQQAFAEISEAYGHYLDALFPGGRGSISLADPDDPQAGVLIEAQPLGKKVAQMSLLSGGERSLVALAFLFAVFDARPSPFYVLDEVEAALDDANLRRFLRIVDRFRNKAQLIIVTHQQQTMEAADVLYGVTMEPGESSKAVRKDMTGVAASRVA